MIVKTPTATYQGAVWTHTVHNVYSLFSLGFSAMRKKKRLTDGFHLIGLRAGSSRDLHVLHSSCVTSKVGTNPLLSSPIDLSDIFGGLMVTHLVKE